MGAMVRPGQYGAKNQIYDAATAAQVLAETGGDINSLMAGWVDRGAWIYYDRIFQPVASTFGGAPGVLAQTYSPFSIGLNKPDAITPGYNKTKLFTNLPNSGQFNPPRCMILQRLGFFCDNMSLVDMVTFFENAYFEFRIDEKIFFEGLLEFHPGGMGFAGATSNNAEAVWTNGIPDPHATRSFGDYSKYIAPLQNFFLTITLPAVSPFTGAAPSLSTQGNGLNIVCLMDGKTDRSVQ